MFFKKTEFGSANGVCKIRWNYDSEIKFCLLPSHNLQMKNPFPKFQKTAEGSWFFVLSDVNTDDSALERELVCAAFIY